MHRWRPKSNLSLFLARLVLFLSASAIFWAQSPVVVTLSPATSPSAAQPAITVVTLVGSNFPTGTISPTQLTVALQVSPGHTGPELTTTVSAIASLVGSSRRVTFQVQGPNVSTPTPYTVSLSGITTAGVVFTSGNQASITINPAPTILSLNPNSSAPGQSLTISITGRFTNYVQGATQANFGPGISVGGGTMGGFGPATVTSATTVNAPLKIDPSAAAGARNVQVNTGIQQVTLVNGFTVNSATNQPPKVNAGPSQTITLISDLFVAGENTSDVLRFNGSTGALIDAFVPTHSGGLNFDNDMVIGPDGNLYVTSQRGPIEAPSNEGAVFRYNGTTGSFIDAFVPLGSGGLKAPTELIFGPDGNLYVSDYGDHNVKRYDGATGAFLGIFTSGGSSLAPQGLRFGADGNLYLADELQVLRYNGSTGAYIGVFVPAGSGGLQEPQCILFGPDGNLYVSDPLGHAVRRYSGTTGAFIDSFVSPGSGGVNLATGIAFGPDGNLYVGDQAGGQILRYEGHTGAFLNVFVPSGTGGLTGSSLALAYIQFENTASATLNGSFSDDGLPSGSTLTATWSKVSGPGPVTFSNPSSSASNVPGHVNSAATSVGFTIPGTYIIRLTASDSQLSNSSDVTITVSPSGSPTILSVVPNTGQQGQQNLSVAITGQSTNFVQGTTTANFGSGITVASFTVSTPTSAAAVINIAPAAAIGAHNVTLTTGSEIDTLPGGFSVTASTSIPAITSVSPSSGQQGQVNLSVAITGQFTHFVQGTTTASFGAGITVASLTVSSATNATAVINIDPAATVGARTVTLGTGTETAALNNGFTVTSCTSFAPNWVQLTQSGSVPLPRVQHSVVYDPSSNRLIAFGGFSCPNGPATCAVTNEVWVLLNANGLSGASSWTQLNPSGSPPAARRGHSAVYDAGTNRMIVFAGNTDTTVVNDVWILINANGLGTPAWQQLLPSGTPPAPRRFTQAVYDAVTNRLVVFGGGVQGPATTNDLWVLTNANGLGGTPAWIQLNPAGALPSPRAFHFASLDTETNRLIVFGGGDIVNAVADNPANYRNDVWVLANANGLGGTPAWTLLLNEGSPGAPSPRVVLDSSQSSTYSAGNHQFMIIGGYVGDCVGSISTCDPSGISNEVWKLSNANGTGGGPFWTKLSLSGGPQRTLGNDIYDPSSDRIINYGGGLATFAANGESSADTWLLTNAFGTSCAAPVLLSITPSIGQQGQQNLSVNITGQFTNWVQGATQASFGSGITVVSLAVNTSTSATAVINIAPAAAIGAHNVTLTTGSEIDTLSGGFSVTAPAPIPTITSVSPNSGPQGQQNLSVTIAGQFTHFVQGTTTASFGAGVTVMSLTVNSVTAATAVININTSTTPGTRTVTLTTGSETATLANGFQVNASLNRAPVVSAGENQTVVQTSQLFVAALTIDSVLRFDGTTGAFLNQFVPTGSAGLHSPDGVVFGPDGNLYVAIQPNSPFPGACGLVPPPVACQSSVLRYDGATGAFIDAFVPQGSGGLLSATFLIFGPDGNLYVSGFQDGTVRRYSGATGAFMGVFATGAAHPQGLQFGQDGNLYVADEVNILRYNGTTGAFMGVFVAAGTGGLNQPQGLVFGPDGNLYESEFFGSVRRFNRSTGAFIDVFVPSGSGGLTSPYGMAFGPDGNLYVGDQSNNGQVLRYDGRTGAFLNVFIPPGTGGTTSVQNELAAGGITFRTAATATLQGVMTDDGLPVGSTLTATWSKISGPGPVVFGSPTLNVPNISGQSYPVPTSARFSAAGSYDLRINASDSQLSSSADVTITVNPPLGIPTITSVSPNSGQQGQQNLSVNIAGQLTKWIQGTTTASFGSGVTVASFAVNTPTSATAVINIASAAAIGAHSVTLTTGSEIDTLPGGFSVTLPAPIPTIMTISPNFGPQGQGGPVTVVGQNTHFVQGVSTLDLGTGITVSNVQVSCPTCLTAQLSLADTAPTGPHNVTVTTGTEVATLSGGFTVQPGTPIVASFGPIAGRQGQSLTLTVTGKFTHFVQGTTLVSLGSGVTVTSISVSAATSLTAQISIDPAASVGTRTLTVTTGTETVSVPNVFNVQQAIPVLLTLNPGGGQQGQTNLSVAITGQFTHFAQGTSQASFGAGVTMTSLTVSSPTAATAVVNIDASAAAGPRNVTVTTGSEAVVFPNGFTVLAGTSAITLVNPNTGRQGQQNLSIAITGQSTHFVQGTSQANFGSGITIASLTVNSPTAAIAVLNIDPVASVGLRDVTVTTGTEVVTLAGGFAVNPAISITLVSPNTGQQGQQNLSIAISGQSTHFAQGTTQASFGTGITIVSLTVSSPTTAAVVLNVDPAATLGPRNVTLTTGAEVASAPNGFTVTSGASIITQVSPNTGRQSQQNLSVTITGKFTNFAQGVSQVSFGAGITVGTVSVTSSTSLSVQISIALNAPLGARTMTVTTGTEVASLANAFSVTAAVNQAPVITIAPTWSVSLPNRLALTYTVTDDNLPSGGALTVSWDTITTPASANVGYQNQTPTSISVGFDTVGTYTLRITATDTQLTATQDITVTVGGTAIPPPTVSISTPTDGSEVTTAVAVKGTVDSQSLSNWVLEYQGPGDIGYHTLATGITTVTNATLGTFDPSLLLNGTAYLRLTATDTAGQSTIAGPMSLILTRNQKIGNFTVSFNDLTVPLTGLPIQVTRTYDSRQRFIPGNDFSYGWTLDLDAGRLAETVPLGDQWNESHPSGLAQYCIDPVKAHVLTVALPDGTTYQFKPALSPHCQPFVPILETTVGFAPAGATPPNASLAIAGNSTVTVNGTLGPVTFLDADTLGIFDPDQYILTLPDGRTLQFSMQFGLQKMTDLNGNTLMITANGITHSSGTSVTFKRDAAKRITAITDPAGHSIQYTYDNLTGDLIGVKDRSNQTTTFTYTADHGLLTIKDPRGVQPIRNDYDANGRLVSHTDAYGNVIHYTYDLGTNQEVVTDRLGNVTVNEYDTDGNVVKVTDAAGGITLRTYDANDNLLQETNALGQTRKYMYDKNNNRAQETDPLGNTTFYTYNNHNQVLTIKDPLGNVTTNVYDDTNGNLKSTTDAAGKVTSYVYNPSGQRISMTDGTGAVTHYEYDASGNLAKQTDPMGNVTSYTYDLNGNKLTETKTRTTASGPETLVTHYQYDPSNRLIQTTYPDGSTAQIQYNEIGKQSMTIDALGRQTSYQYDLMGRLLQTTYPDSTSESSTYDAEGGRLSSTDRLGRKTSYLYDALKRLTKTTYPDGATAQTVYDVIGEVKTVTDALGNATHYAYDDAGRRTGVMDALGHQTGFTYDAGGNQASMTDANGNTTQYQYDKDNRRTQTIYPDSTTDTVAYDALGRTISKTDQAGRTTQFKYDALGRLIQVTDALNQITSYGYDEVGNRISLRDANSHVTSFAYDKMGRRTTRTLPLGMSESMIYDLAGNLTKKTDFNGNATTYLYDQLNRLTSKTPDAKLSEPTVTFTYTKTGHRQSMVDASGTTLYTSDERDRLLTKATPQGTLNYTYDLAGNLLTVRSSNANGTSVNYAYDALNRLSSVTDNRLTSGTTTYHYDNAGNLFDYSYPNGVKTTYAYNTLNRLHSLSVASGSNTLASYSYTLGLAGNRTGVTELGGRQVSYTYDALYRLTGETISGGTVNGAIGYSYDPVGNRLSRTSTMAPVPAATYSYDANDRLISDGYDANGNTTASGSNTYTYDFENHLKSKDGGAVTVIYDGDGNRVAKMAGGVTTEYLVDDRNLTGYAQVLEEISAGTVQRVYTYGLNRISQSQASGTSFYGYDGHGSVRLLTDATGAVTDRYDYDAFGNIISQTGTTPNVYLYSGEQNDPNVGLYYLRARYLNIGTGRFVTGDTFPGDPQSPLSLHKYLYVSGNPVNRRDPSGHLSIPELTTTVTVENILAEIEFTHVVFPAITIGVELTIDRLGFEDLNEALQLAADASNPLIVLAADDLYSAGNQLIALGSRTIILAKDYTDIAKGVTSVVDATGKVAAAINDAYAASGRVTVLLSQMYDLFGNFATAAQDTVTVLTNQTPVPKINNNIVATADASRVFFEVVLKIATSGNTSGLIIRP